MGWILETNEPMNRAMKGMGGEVVKRYRLYERSLQSRTFRALPASLRWRPTPSLGWIE